MSDRESELLAFVISLAYFLCTRSGTPTLQQLLKALKKLENWCIFGVVLGVPYPQLRKIELNHEKDADRCKLDMLQYWLDNKLVPKWNEVILALEEIDQLVLAAEIKHDYLWSTTDTSEDEGMFAVVFTIDMSKPAPDTPVASSATPFSTLSIVTDEIEADVTVVSSLKDLENSFGGMIVRVKRHLENCSLSDAKLFLYSAVGTKDFSECDDFGKLLEKLQEDHIDVFNVSLLQQLVSCFDNCEQTLVIEAYIEKKENFLKLTTVLEFQRAVVSRVEPILASGMAVVTVKVPKKTARHRTLKDIEQLAMDGFEECHKKFIRLHAEPGSIIISWVFPKELSGRLEQLTRDNAAIFKDNGVLEVTVGGRRVFPSSQQEVRINEL